MGEFKEAVEVYSNFITPPDFVDDPRNHTVLMIDVEDIYVQQVAAWCKTADTSFNVYLFNHTMGEKAWLHKVIRMADKIIVNTIETKLTPLKENLDPERTLYFSVLPTNEENHIRNPLEYFISIK